MGLRRNTIANYAGEGYTALIGVIVLPLYLQFLGAEAFGLVGFFLLLQAWLYLLDFGLSPTLAREVAYAKGLAGGLLDFGRMLRSIELIFLFLATALAVGIYWASGKISHQWIDSQTIAEETISYCITLMGITIALRLFSSLYRSGIRGLEDQVWLNFANVLIVSARFIGALAVMRLISADIRVFFELQILVGIAEVIILGFRLYGRLSLGLLEIPIRIHWPSLRNVAPFALSIAYTAGIWVMLTQFDKLVLSGILPLDEFGYFSLVSLIAGGVLVMTGPIVQAILPRMTSLLAEGRRDEMLHVYRNASQLVAVLAVSTALVIGTYSEVLLYAWTGDRAAARWGAEVLPWFVFGNAFLALSAFQYYLQNAFGELRLHVIGTTISVVIQVPIIYYAATNYGAVGAGIAWFGIRLVWFAVWAPIVHGRLAPGLHLVWISKDLLPVVVVAGLTIAALVKLVAIDLSDGRLVLASMLVALGLVELAAAAASSEFARSLISEFLSRLRGE